MAYQLPPLDDEAQFERLVGDILRRVYEDPGIERFGRSGSARHSVRSRMFIVSGFQRFNFSVRSSGNEVESPIQLEFRSANGAGGGKELKL
jgi:hypothetical protein